MWVFPTEKQICLWVQLLFHPLAAGPEGPDSDNEEKPRTDTPHSGSQLRATNRTIISFHPAVIFIFVSNSVSPSPKSRQLSVRRSFQTNQHLQFIKTTQSTSDGFIISCRACFNTEMSKSDGTLSRVCVWTAASIRMNEVFGFIITANSIHVCLKSKETNWRIHQNHQIHQIHQIHQNHQIHQDHQIHSHTPH